MKGSEYDKTGGKLREFPLRVPYGDKGRGSRIRRGRRAGGS